MRISTLISGGIIPNYRCSATCRHCLYACSPSRDPSYMSEQTMSDIGHVLAQNGCPALHIGGGEPFLNPECLASMLDVLKSEMLPIDYVETNSSWFRGEAHASAVLESLKVLGITTLLLSISPFHNEYVPLDRVTDVMAACRRAGVRIFPWTEDFYKPLAQLDTRVPHTISEQGEIFGHGFEASLPQAYWIHMGGRAVWNFRDIVPLRPLSEILDSGPCTELIDSSHFHVDLYGNYIPGLCTGLAVHIEDIGSSLTDSHYPLLNILFNDGVRGLLTVAQREWDFSPNEAYLGKCHLCLAIRSYLFSGGYAVSDELQPEEFYRQPSIEKL